MKVSWILLALRRGKEAKIVYSFKAQLGIYIYIHSYTYIICVNITNSAVFPHSVFLCFLGILKKKINFRGIFQAVGLLCRRYTVLRAVQISFSGKKKEIFRDAATCVSLEYCRRFGGILCFKFCGTISYRWIFYTITINSKSFPSRKIPNTSQISPKIDSVAVKKRVADF